MTATLPSLFFRIHGMDCAEEVVALKREVGRVVGGEERLAFDILGGTMTITAGPEDIAPETIINAVARTGLRAEIWRDESSGPRVEGFWQRRGQTTLTAASGLLTLVGFLVHVGIVGGLRAVLGSEGMGIVHGFRWHPPSS